MVVTGEAVASRGGGGTTGAGVGGLGVGVEAVLDGGVEGVGADFFPYEAVAAAAFSSSWWQSLRCLWTK